MTPPIRTFEQMAARLYGAGCRKRIAVVCPDDEHTQQAVGRALSSGLADVLLVGPAERYAGLFAEQAEAERVQLLDAPDAEAASRLAVGAIRDGRADVLMKGLVRTDILLRAVLDKQRGLLPAQRVLTHVAVAELPGWERLLFFSDAAVIPSPTRSQRVAQVRVLAHACRCFGIDEPAVALLHYSETVSERFPVTLDYAELKHRAEWGEFGPIKVDGPMDIVAACTPGAAQVKHIQSSIAGRADALLLPDLEAANLLYKSLSLFGHAQVAGVLQGADCPVVLTSRTDSSATKFHSLAFAAMLAAQ